MLGKRGRAKKGSSDTAMPGTTRNKAHDGSDSELIELRSKNEDLERGKAKVDDDNWTLRIELQSMAAQTESTNSELQKTKQDLSKLLATHSTTLDESSQLRNKLNELSKQLEQERTLHKRDAEFRRNELETRENDIDELAKSLEDARSNLARLEAANKRLANPEISPERELGQNTSVSEISAEFDPDLTPTDTVPPGLVPEATPYNGSLESDTQRAALSYAVRKQKQLYAALQREKVEKRKIQQQLAQLQQNIKRNTDFTMPMLPFDDPKASRLSVASSVEDTDGFDSQNEEGWAHTDSDQVYATAEETDRGLSTSSDYYATATSQSETEQYFSSRPGVSEYESDDSGLDTATGEEVRGYPLSDEVISRDDVEQYAAAHGLKIIACDDLQVQESSHDDRQGTTLDYIKQQAETKHDAKVLTNEQYLDLTRPSKEWLVARASEIDHQLLPNAEYDHLLHPGLEELTEAANLLKYNLIPEDDLHNSESAERSKIMALAESHGMKVLSHEEWSLPSLHWLRDRAQKSGHLVIPEKSLSEVAVSSEDSSHVLQELINTHKLQLAHPRNDSQYTSNNGSRSSSPELSTVATKEQLEKFANSNGLTLVPANSIISITPDGDVASGATSVNRGSTQSDDRTLVALNNDDLNLWKELKRSRLQHAELTELRRKAHNPSVDEIASLAASHGLATINIDKLSGMQRQLEGSLSTDLVREAAEKHDLVVLDRSEFDSLSDWNSQAKLHGSVVLSEEHYQSLEKPDPATISRLAKEKGLAVITEDELASINEKKSQPTGNALDDIHSTANNLGLVVMAKTELEDILVSLKNAERQSKDTTQMTLAERRKHLEEIMLDQTSNQSSPKHGPLSSPNKTRTLEATYRSLGYIRIPRSEYDKLLATQKAYEPTKSDLIRAAKQFNLVVVPVDTQRKNISLPIARDRDPASPTRAPSSPFRDSRPQSMLQESDSDLEMQAVSVPYLQALRRMVEEPTRGDLDTMADRLGLSIVDDNAMKTLEAVKTQQLVQPLCDEDIIDRALQLGLARPLADEDIIVKAKDLGLVEPLDDHQIMQRARALGLVTHNELLEVAKRNGLTEPLSKEDILSKARSYGLVDVLSDEELFSNAKAKGLVEPLTDPDIIAIAKKKGLIEPLSKDDILSEARSHGLVDALSDEDLLNNARQKGLVDPLTESEIVAIAKKKGLIEPLSKEDILSEARSYGLVDALSDEELLRNARAKGLVDPLKESEILAIAKDKGLVEPPSRDTILSRARSYGLVDALSDAEILDAARGIGLVDPLSEPEILAIAREKGLVAPLSDDDIISRATNLGLATPLSTDEILLKAKTLGLCDPLTDAQILSRARELGLVQPITDDDIIIRAKAIGLSYPIDESQLLERARSLGLSDPLTDGQIVARGITLGMISQPSDDDVKQQARALGLIDPIDDDDIIKRAKLLGLIEPLSENDLRRKATDLGLVDPLSDQDILAKARTLGLEDPLSGDALLAKAKSLGLVAPVGDDEIRSKAKALGLINPPSDKAICEKAKRLGLVDPLSDEDVCERALKIGLIYPLTDDTVCERAKTIGLIDPHDKASVTAGAKSLGLVEPPSDEDILRRAATLGLAKPLSDDDIRNRAASIGMTEPLTDDELADRVTTLGISRLFSKHQICAAAAELGMIEPMSDEDLIEKAKSVGLAPSIDDSQVVSRAKELGLVDPLSRDQLIEEAIKAGLSRSSVRDKVVDGAELEKSKDFQPTVNDLATVGPDSVVASFVSSDSYSPESESEVRPSDGQKLEPVGSTSNSSKVTRVSNGHSIIGAMSSSDGSVRVTSAPAVSTSLSYRQHMKQKSSAPGVSDIKRITSPDDDPNAARVSRNECIVAATANDDLSNNQPECDVASVTSAIVGTDGKKQRDVSAYTPPLGPTGKMNPPRLPGGDRSPVRSSFRGHFPRPGFGSTSSISSIFSSGKAEIYKANVPQLFVGECLYKYSHGFLDGLNGGRHRRYFWVHPYTMTLYWQRDNPAILGGRSGKPKSAPISYVEQVSDFNPLPAGLYYKSLIIKTTNGHEIKVTCPTRGRHHVWYTSLRYLLDNSYEAESESFPATLRGM